VINLKRLAPSIDGVKPTGTAAQLLGIAIRRFLHDADADCFICLAGHTLHRKPSRRKRRMDTTVRYYADAAIMSAERVEGSEG